MCISNITCDAPHHRKLNQACAVNKRTRNSKELSFQESDQTNVRIRGYLEYLIFNIELVIAKWMLRSKFVYFRSLPGQVGVASESEFGYGALILVTMTRKPEVTPPVTLKVGKYKR